MARPGGRRRRAPHPLPVSERLAAYRAARPPHHPLIGLLVAFFWMALVLGLYYWAHKPLTPAFARAAGGALLDLVVTAALALPAAGLGRRLLRAFDLGAISAAERLAIEALLGLGALALALFAVGALALRWWSVGALLVALAWLTRREIAGWLRDCAGMVRGGAPRSRWGRGLAAFVIALLALGLALATLPPTAWDALTYHLAGPEQYVAHGRFYAVPNNHFLGFPQLVETLYAGQIALTGRLTAGGLLHGWIGALALLITGGYTARAMHRAAGWLAAALLIGAASIWHEMTFAYVDLMPMALGMAALVAAECWAAGGRQRTRWLVLFGALVGLALGCKYTAIWLALALGVLLLALSRGDPPRVMARHALIAAGTAALIVLPWLVRNAVWYDNPVYPFFFEGGGMDAIRQDWYSQPRSGLIYASDAWQIPLMPAVATIFGLEGEGSYGVDVGPWFLILTPLAGLAWRRFTAPERVAVRRTLIVAGAITAAWIASSAFGSYGNRQTRLVLYVFPPLAVTGALTLEALRRLPPKPLDLGFIMRAMLVLTLALGLVNALRETITSGVAAYYAGEDGFRDAYLEEALGWHVVALREASALPEGSRIRFLWEPRYLYCDQSRVTCVPDSLMDGWYYARRTVGDGSPAAIAAAWQRDADYLLVYDFGARFERDDNTLYTAADWAAWDAFVAEQLEPVWQGASDDETIYTIYRWRAP